VKTRGEKISIGIQYYSKSETELVVEEAPLSK